MRGAETQLTTASEDLRGLHVPHAPSVSDSTLRSRGREDWLAPESFRRDTVFGDISSCIRDTEVVRLTCEFLRKREPLLYNELWEELQKQKPLNENPLLSTRQARDAVPPLPSVDHVERGTKPQRENSEERRSAPYPLALPKIDTEHWAYARHAQVGHYVRPRDKAEERAAKHEEGRSDIAVINTYLKAYRELSQDVSGKNLWKATRHPADRSPYYTTMEIVKQEANPPEHFYALIHYGMGLHMLYELSLARKAKDAPTTMAKLTDVLQRSFKAIARAYRQDFC